MHQLAKGDFALAAAGVAHYHAVAVELLVQAVELLFQDLVARLQLAALGGQVGLGGGVQLAVQLQLALFQAQALETVVDPADVALLQLVELGVEVIHPLHALLQFAYRGVAFGDHLAVLLDAQQVAVEVAPLAAFENHQRFGALDVLQPLADDPGEIAAVKLAVAQLEQLAGHEFGAGLRDRHAGAAQARARHFLGLDHLADHGLGGFARDLVSRLDDVRRPEVAEAAYRDHRQQSDCHDHRDRHRAGVHPHPGRAAAEPGFDGFLFLFHRAIPPPLTTTRISCADADGSALPGCSSRR